MVGSALVQGLKQRNYKNIIIAPFQALDLRSQSAVDAFFAEERPEWVILAAARVTHESDL